MRTKFSRTVLAVGIALALAFTFSCSSGGGGGNEQNGEGSSSSSKPSSSSSNGNVNSSSSVGGGASSSSAGGGASSSSVGGGASSSSAGGGASSSSVGGGTSSSSEAVWVFGNPETVDAPLNTPITIGSGSVKLIVDPDCPHCQEDYITVYGGTIRSVYTDTFYEEGVVPGKAYSSKVDFLGSTVPSTSTTEFSRLTLIYLGDGIYLLKLTKSATNDWQCTYWRATKSP